jgi:hypothetical protein
MVTNVLRRDHQLEDGIGVLANFAPGPVQIDSVFDGENEFIDLFAKQLARRDSEMWRDTGGGEFGFTKIGLFPIPAADPAKFYTLGLLCGKALAMTAARPLPLSEQFFRFLDGEELTLADIDDDLARSVPARDDLILLKCPFTYPGHNDLELVKNGASMSVDESNYGKSVEFVTEFICGSWLSPMNKGFSSVIENGLWYRLTA